MIEHVERQYHEFFGRFSAARYERYVSDLTETLGPTIYRFSTTPLFLSADRYERLVAITNSVVALLKSPAYQRSVNASPWFIPRHPMHSSDYFGCVDFHVGDEDEKIIEVNFCPPGHVGLTELVERRFFKAFGLDGAGRSNDGVDRAIVDAATEGGYHTKVAIGVNHTARSKNYYPHYKYIERIFATEGVDARVFYAKDVMLDAERRPMWDGERFDRIFNLVIPRIMQYDPEPFERYLAVFREHPRMFFPNPLGWRLGTKIFMAVCYALARESFGLADEHRERILGAALETYRLSDFRNPAEVADRFGGASNVVLKPVDDYHARGVVIRPSLEELERVFAAERERYVAQRYYPPHDLPHVSLDGRIETYHGSVRVGFLNGRASGVRSYTYTDPLGWDEITPVVVV